MTIRPSSVSTAVDFAPVVVAGVDVPLGAFKLVLAGSLMAVPRALEFFVTVIPASEVVAGNREEIVARLEIDIAPAFMALAVHLFSRFARAETMDGCIHAVLMHDVEGAAI